MWKMKKCEMQKRSHVCSRRGILPLRSSASTAATGWDRRGKLLSQRSAQNNHIWCIGLFASLIAVFCFVYILSSFRVDCRSLLWKTRWRRGWWRSRGRSRACWRRPSAPRAARGRHHGSMTSNSCWSCLTSEDECYRVFTAVTAVDSVDHFVINSVRLCARVRVELVTF